MGVKIAIHKGVVKTISLAFETTDSFGGIDNYPGIPLASSAARKLSKTLRVRITGTVGTWVTGKTIICGKRTKQPTISLPIEKITDVCFINARIDRVEFFDSSTGKVLLVETPPTKRR